MKSGTSLFDKGVSKSLLKRFWPLWAVYLGALIIALPVYLVNSAGSAYIPGDLVPRTEYITALSAQNVMLPFIAAAAAAGAVFSYLYNSKSCGMMCSLPIKRETMFISVYLTGLVPMLLSHVLTVLITALFGVVEFKYLLIWLGISSMLLITFYGIAVFCAMLTGSAVIMPLVYVVLNFTASVVESTVRELLSCFVYGMPDISGNSIIDFLSPVEFLSKELIVFVKDDSFEIIGTGTAALYCAVGIALSVLAFFLYKKRRMETAGDSVAIDFLKPVFKYCMSFGTALVFASFMVSVSRGIMPAGRGAAVYILIAMLAGAFLGFFAAKMIIAKSLKVFRGPAKGLIAVCLIICIFVMGFELDIFGYEKRIPDRDKILSVRIMKNVCLEEPENIDRAIELHTQLVSHKEKNENAAERFFFCIDYTLEDGSTLSREYDVSSSPLEFNDPESDISRLDALNNTVESIACREIPGIPVREDTVYYARIDSEYPDQSYDTAGTRLSPAQAAELYNDCILPDLKEGRIGRMYYAQSDEYLDKSSNVYIHMDLRLIEKDSAGITLNENWDSVSITLTMDAERTMKWILEKTDIEPISVRELRELQADSGTADWENVPVVGPWG